MDNSFCFAVIFKVEILVENDIWIKFYVFGGLKETLYKRIKI